MNEHVFFTMPGFRWDKRLFAPEDGAGGAAAAAATETPAAKEGDAGDQTNLNEGQTSDEGATDTGKAPGAGTALGGGEPGETSEATDAQDGDADSKGEQQEGDDLDQVPEDGRYTVFDDLPEGLSISDEDKSFWDEQFKELGLTKRQADQVRTLAIADRQRQEASVMAAIEAQQQEHAKQAHADKELGGANWQATVALANKALDALRGGGRQTFDSQGNPTGGSPAGAIENLILATGNGNNPEVLRELKRIGELFKDDTFSAGRPVEAPTSTETKWYGGTTPDKKRG